MTLICPDVLAEARGLSPGASGFLLFVGFLLWAFGWRWHRFWVVFAITLTAGLLGISDSTVKREWRMAKAWLYEKMKS